MNPKITGIIGVIAIILMIAAVVFLVLLVPSSDSTSTTWGSWDQEYIVHYKDGSESPLSIFHNEKEINNIEYKLAAKVSADVTLDFTDYHLLITSNETEIVTVDFEGSFILVSGEERTLFTKIINLDEMLTWDEGRFLIECMPTGSIKIGCCDDSVLPSSASFFANVESETVSGIELYLDSGIVWNYEE